MPGAFIERSASASISGVKISGADQPVGLVGGLLERPLLDQRAEHVGHRLVQGARLVVILEPGGELRDAVGELVGDHVERAVKSVNTTPSPSPNTICWPFQKALL